MLVYSIENGAENRPRVGVRDLVNILIREEFLAMTGG